MASKSVVYDYVENASKEAKELIAKFELEGDQEMLVKALVAAYCRGVDAVDGYLRNSLSAYRTSVKNQQWISVSDRLPEENQEVLISYGQKPFFLIAFLYYPNHPKKDVKMFCGNNNTNYSLDYVTHWQPLSAPLKEDK